MEVKRFKDPIYGYVSIDIEIVSRIIDTDTFQRLRNIRQTSYAPLYSAALHNRFIHSIGVYYLGRLVSKQLSYSSVGKVEDSNIKKYCKTFELACLLHDVGHSPFSHSGEKFYLTFEDINEKIKEIVNNDAFSKDADSYVIDKKAANPHEIMSVIVALEKFSNVIGVDNFDFFARCIVGYKYDGDTPDEKIKNCFISMLNSDIIDVDKLDYLIRDSYVTGYDNVNIDYNRLLSSIMISNDGKYNLMYHKNALSVIENVVYARDAEKKWIQNHPAVLYEIFLIQYTIKKANDFYEEEGKHLFCYEALTAKGIDFNKRKKHVSLLADEDVISIIKNEVPDELINEFFSRVSRRHPIWKSEAEYQSLFRRTLGEELLDKLELDMEALYDFVQNSEDMVPVINTELLNFYENKIKELTSSEEIDDVTKKENIDAINGNLRWFYLLKKYAEKNDIDFDFVIITADMFRSGFSKKGLEELLIYFPEFNKINQLKDVTYLFKLNYTRDNFFYIFYKRNLCEQDFECANCNKNCKINISKFTKYMRDNVENV